MTLTEARAGVKAAVLLEVSDAAIIARFADPRTLVVWVSRVDGRASNEVGWRADERGLLSKQNKKNR